jgi:hypothetical protein
MKVMSELKSHENNSCGKKASLPQSDVTSVQLNDSQDEETSQKVYGGAFKLEHMSRRVDTDVK